MMKGNPTLLGAARAWPSPTASMQTMEDVEQAMFEAGDPRRPSYSEAGRGLYPTPVAAGRRVNRGGGSGRVGPERPGLELMAERGMLPSSPLDPETTTDGPTSSTATRRLNPLFVEWLQAWPRGWTDFAPVGTEYTRWLRRWRSYLCGTACTTEALYEAV